MFVIVSLFDVSKNKTVTMRDHGDIDINESLVSFINILTTTSILYEDEKYYYFERFFNYKVDAEILIFVFTNSHSLENNQVEKNKIKKNILKDYINIENDPLDISDIK